MKNFALITCFIFMFGCNSNRQPVVNPEVVLQPTVPDLPAPEPNSPSPAPEPEPKQDDPNVTPDGRIRVSGDVWELDVPLGSPWQVLQNQQYILAIVNVDSHTLVVLNREDWVASLTDYAAYQISDAQKVGGSVLVQKHVHINGRDLIYLEVKMKSARVQNWLLTTGAEAFALSCGGAEKYVKNNNVICEDLANHFYVGKKI